jgi:hypothetical protein
MGCSIHLITEIRKDGKWEYVPEKPTEFTSRNHKLFALFSNVTNYFGINSFDVKGLPEDISSTKYGFESYTTRGKERYFDENDGDISFINSNGEIISVSDIPKTILSQEEYNALSNEMSNPETDKEIFNRRYHSLGYSESKGVRTYFVQDASKNNGHFERVPYYKLYPTLEDFMADIYEYEWDEDKKEYGEWQVDFSNSSFYSANYLTLKELVETDYTDFFAIRYKMDTAFYDAFIQFGGVLPEEMKIVPYKPTEFSDIIRNSISPITMIAWNPTEEDKNESSLFKGIAQLKDIAFKYGIEDYSDIRIVFAFDN